MAVTDCSEIAEGRGGDLTIDDDNDTRVYNVTCSLATDDKYTILASGLLPALLSDHPKNGTRPQNRRLYLRRYRIRQLHGNFIWRVECEYETNVPANTTNSAPQLAKETQPVPLLRRVNCRMVSETYRRPVKRGYLLHSGTLATWKPDEATIPQLVGPISNSARERFNPAPETDAERQVWHIDWNVDRLPHWFKKYSNAINADPVLIRGELYPRWSLKVGKIGFSDLNEETAPSGLVYGYYTVSFDVQYKLERWVVMEPDLGLYQLVGGKPVRMEDDQMVPMATPRQLDGSGAKVTSPTDSTACYRIWLDAETPVLPFNNYVPLPAQP